MHFNGRNPTGKCGEYFSNNDQWWGQVAEYCKMVAPEIYAAWFSNIGDGLDSARAVALADALQKEVDSGRTETFAQELAALLMQMFGSEPEGADYVRPGASKYPFSSQNVAAFAAFLRESGGIAVDRTDGVLSENQW